MLIRKGILNNLGLKIFSLIFALVLWFFVSGKGKTYTEISYTLPLEFQNIPKNLIITNDFVDKIEIRISGPTAILNSLRSKNLKYTIDLGGISAGETSFAVNTENIDLLRGLKATKISPSKINLVLEKVTRKTVPVKLNITGELPEGYKIFSQKLTPANLEIKGAESEVNAIAFIPTVEIDLSNVRNTIIGEIDIIFRDIFYSEIIDKKNIAVEIEVGEEIVYREIKGVDVQLANQKEGEAYNVIPKKADITVTGTFLNMKNFKDEDATIFVNVENVADKKESIKVEFHLPAGISVKSSNPEQFEVEKVVPKKKGKKKKKKKKGKKK